jgi:5-(carboxyamino)imidazole ribonucleotide mutase
MSTKNTPQPVVGIIMGSGSDGPTMNQAADILRQFAIPYEINVISAHRTPEKAHDYAVSAATRGLKIIIAGAGMAAHLAGAMAALTPIPVLGVPMEGKLAGGLDALLATVQMPKGIPVATFAVGTHGAINAALFAVAILALSDHDLRVKLTEFRRKQTDAALKDTPAVSP